MMQMDIGLIIMMVVCEWRNGGLDGSEEERETDDAETQRANASG